MKITFDVSFKRSIEYVYTKVSVIVLWICIFFFSCTKVCIHRMCLMGVKERRAGRERERKRTQKSRTNHIHSQIVLHNKCTYCIADIVALDKILQSLHGLFVCWLTLPNQSFLFLSALSLGLFVMVSFDGRKFGWTTKWRHVFHVSYKLFWK